MRFGSQVLLLQLATVAAVVLLCIGIFAWSGVRQLEAEAEATALAIARTVSEDPDVRSAVAEYSADPGRPTAAALRDGPLEEIASRVEARTGALFVVITDDEGIRLAHPDEERLGELVSTSPAEALRGEESVAWQAGTLGESARAKVPVFGADAAGSESSGSPAVGSPTLGSAVDSTVVGSPVVGEVSVGFARSSVFVDLPVVLLGIGLAGLASLVLGAAASVLIRRRLLRLTLGLQPEEIRGLVQDQAAVLDGVGEGVLAFSLEGRVTVCNAEAAEILSLTDPLGLDLSELHLDPPVADAIRTRSTETGTPTPDSTGFVIGERIVYLDVRRVMRGRIDLGIVVILRDRTDLASLTKRLDAVATMTSALRVQRHEFANRLHVIAGLLDADRHSEARDFLDEVLLRGPLKYPVEHADRLQEPYLQAIVGAKGIEAAERGVLLTLGAETLVQGTVGAPEDVATILGNLVDNAVTAAVEGSATSRYVEVELLDDGTELYLTVADSGDGVSSAETLFERDARGEQEVDGTSRWDDHVDAARVHGRGFGLPLCRELARRRGGDVWLAEAGTPGGPGAVICARIPGAMILPGGHPGESDPDARAGADSLEQTR